MKSYLKLPLLFAIIILNVCCKTELPPSGLVTENAMVVSARQEASAIGSAILARGGNAFDAMVATELALAVAYPFAGNLGGVALWSIEKSMEMWVVLTTEKKHQPVRTEIYI